MTEPRESPRAGPEDDAEEARPAPSRRFARLVQSPATRRVSLPKLAGALAGGLLVAGLAWFGVTRISQVVTDYVEAQPQHQIAFSEIELVPEPPPWIPTGAAGLLHRVGVEARREGRLSVPSVDLKELEKDFRRCPWVEDVRSVERSFGRLSVRLTYRKPVAVAEVAKGRVVVIDKDGVILPEDIDWVEKDRNFRARGVDKALTFIRNVPPPTSIRPGLPWKRADATDLLGGRDLEVLGAARLADFLRGRPGKSPAGRDAPEILLIWSDPETLGYFLKDSRDNWIYWDKAPRSEPPGEPTAGDKWKMLLDWVDRLGPLEAKSPDFLKLTKFGAEMIRRARPSPRPPGAH